jgi:hypothetical protein
LLLTIGGDVASISIDINKFNKALVAAWILGTWNMVLRTCKRGHHDVYMRRPSVVDTGMIIDHRCSLGILAPVINTTTIFHKMSCILVIIFEGIMMVCVF